jgi:molybdate transport system ATP-binding protein
LTDAAELPGADSGGARTLRVELAQESPIPLDVRFACAPGEVLAIFGPSGAGKTTILRAIAGLHAPAEAHVAVGSDVWLDTRVGIAWPAHRRSCGFVFQEYALFPHLDARANVEAALGGRPRDERRRRAEELLALVHLDGRSRRRPDELSGGERQRVALARALAREPTVLLLDEPFAAVDRAVRRRLQDEIDELRRALAIPLVLVTHDFEDVVRLATHLLLLDRGRAVACGPVEEVTSRPAAGWLAGAVGPGAVFAAELARVDAARGLAELAFAGGTLLAPDPGLPAGTRVRVRIPAREVILATDAPAGLSLHNILAATVTAVRSAPESSLAVVQLAVGDTRLLAEVTRDAIERLEVVEGRQLRALVKSVALEVLATGERHRSA